MQRWAIALDERAQRHLTEEQLELGNEIIGVDGSRRLVFRDRFVGLRVARSLGTELTPYQETVEAALA